MKLKVAKKAFREYLASKGERLPKLTPARAVVAMTSFYRDVRADGCPIEADGDMLLFEWGIFDWGSGARFEIDIVRQLIAEPGDDDDIWQLHLTFRCEPTEALEGLGKGSRWCHSPHDLPDFLAFVESHPIFRALPPGSVFVPELWYECAG